MAGCSEGGTAGPLGARALYSTLAHSRIAASKSPTLDELVTPGVIALFCFTVRALSFFVRFISLLLLLLLVSNYYIFKACYCVFEYCVLIVCF